jgi:hypothetical protein
MMAAREVHMWMECQDDGPAMAPAHDLRAWLHTETFEYLAEVNEKCLELLTEQALTRAPHAHPVLRELVDLWRSLDSSARRRAAGCPYLILDAGFADPRRWRSLSRFAVQERERPYFGTFFTVARTADVARLVFTYAWYLARTQSVAARMVLGMPAHCASLLSGCTLGQISDFAQRNVDWLRPRWPARIHVWRDFLTTARAGDAAALEQVRMHGLQILAAESRGAGGT